MSMSFQNLHHVAPFLWATVSCKEGVCCNFIKCATYEVQTKHTHTPFQVRNITYWTRKHTHWQTFSFSIYNIWLLLEDCWQHAHEGDISCTNGKNTLLEALLVTQHTNRFPTYRRNAVISTRLTNHWCNTPDSTLFSLAEPFNLSNSTPQHSFNTAIQVHKPCWRPTVRMKP